MRDVHIYCEASIWILDGFFWCLVMAISCPWAAELSSFLDDHEIIQPDSRRYNEETKTWAAQRNQSPKLLLRPRSVKQLARVLAYLNGKELDFAVRSGGVGSSSAKDVLISLSAFDGFEHDPAAETITIGAGQTWGEVDEKLEEAAPGYAVVTAFKLKIHKYTNNIYSGNIIIPNEALPELARAVAEFTRRTKDSHASLLSGPRPRGALGSRSPAGHHDRGV
ncbi:hypothetical protein CLCR_10455 [Cladophialophora carrionii]|uniref:FAD linked oxidase N-terminal domain-containing protein n=1 Tax=Cladophialophora carrionii TaxID=86049 RepID=A0A1C1CVN3_9EURO|nr:hypothetical protein CLCR_10455 [Cladophialophora carrionii]